MKGVSIVSTLFVVSLAGSAAAGEEGEGSMRLPVAEAERPITLPRLVLSPELGYDVVRLPAFVAPGAVPVSVSAAVYSNLSLGVSFGIIDDLTVRAQVAPLELPIGAGSFHYGQTTEFPGPSVGLTYRFLRGGVEMGVGVDGTIVTASGLSGASIAPSVPVRIHVGKSFRLDTGVLGLVSTISATGVGSSTTTGGLAVPVSALFDITEPLHVGVSTGFLIGDFKRPGETSVVPLGLFAGYAIAGKQGPILDIDPFLTWPTLFTPGVSNTPTMSGNYMIGISLGGFLYF
jgi:hypothetical protein